MLINSIELHPENKEFIFVTAVVLKDVKSIEINELHPENEEFIFFKLSKLVDGNIISSKFSQSLNMDSIFSNEVKFKLYKSNDFIDLSPLNKKLISVI